MPEKIEPQIKKPEEESKKDVGTGHRPVLEQEKEVQEKQLTEEDIPEEILRSSNKSHLYLDMMEDFESFPEDIQEFLKKIFSGEKLEKDKQSRFSSFQERWWKKKHGKKTWKKKKRKGILSKWASKRRELLGKPPKKSKKIDKKRLEEIKKEELEKDLPEEFYEVVASANNEKIKSLKEKMMEENPESLEWVEAIFAILELIGTTGGKIERRSGRKKEHREISAENRFLVNHFIHSNSKNRELLKDFWNIYEKVVFIFHKDGEGFMKGFRNGLLGEVAAWHLLERIGKNPKLAHPDEDARQSIDLWWDKEKAVQIKSKAEGETHLQKVDSIAFPALSFKDGETETLVDAQRRGKKSPKGKFVINLEKYSDLKGRDIKGYWLTIGKERDDITGEPSDEVVERVKQEFKEIQKQERKQERKKKVDRKKLKMEIERFDRKKELLNNFLENNKEELRKLKLKKIKTPLHSGIEFEEERLLKVINGLEKQIEGWPKKVLKEKRRELNKLRLQKLRTPLKDPKYKKIEIHEATLEELIEILEEQKE